MKSGNSLSIKIAVFAGIISLLVYLKALSCGFIILDDPLYVQDNPAIRSLSLGSVFSMFTSTYVNWWMPLTWLSLAIDYHFWGLNPYGYHLTNIVLHALNTALMVLVADEIFKISEIIPEKIDGTERCEAENNNLHYGFSLLIAGLLWGIHPLRVESVVWVTERKDVLNGLFALGSMLCYLRYAQSNKSDISKQWLFQYFLAFGLFCLSLMAKSVTVVIPVVFLALDWFILERFHGSNFRSVLIEKVPFFLVSAVMTVATIFFIGEASFLITNENFPFSQRFVVSGNAIFEYCRLLLYPVGIVPLHLIPDPIPFTYKIKTVIVIFLTVICIYTGRKNGARILVLLCFVLPLLPVLAFFQNGDQSFAARFTYLPSVAPCIAFAYLSLVLYRRTLKSRILLRFALSVFIAVLIIVYIGLTQKLIPVWNNSETFWNRVVEVEPSAIALKERGCLFVQMKKYDLAVQDFSQAIKNPVAVWLPYIYNLYAFRGEAERLAGNNENAVKDFTVAIGMLPHPVYYRLRGIALKEIGRAVEAEDDFKRAGDEVGPLAWYWSKTLEYQK